MRREKLSLVFSYATLIPALIWLGYSAPEGIVGSLLIGGAITFVINRLFIFKQ